MKIQTIKSNEIKDANEIKKLLSIVGMVIVEKDGKNYLHMSFKFYDAQALANIIIENAIVNVIFSEI